MENVTISNCKRCNIAPKIVNIDGIYYTYCPKCKHHGTYNCCSRSREGSIEQWNTNNRAIATYERPQRKVAIEPEVKKTLPHVIILKI